MSNPASIKWRNATLVALALLGFALCYGKVAWALHRQWISNDTYSHGFLIPIISVYLAVLKINLIEDIRIHPNLTVGFLLFLSGLLLLVAGYYGGILVMQELSIIVTLFGMTFLLFGTRISRIMWFPIAYLVFMIPTWEFLIERAQLPFQVLSADIGVKLLSQVGIPIYQNGIFIELPNITLEVAKACSGINYLISVLAIGIPLSYMYIHSNSKRAILVLSAAAIAMFGNGLRVFFVGLCAYYQVLGKNMDVHGPFHIFQGLFVSGIGYVVLFTGVSLLKEKKSSPIKRDCIKNMVSGFISKDFHPVLWGIVILLFLSSAGAMYARGANPVRLKQDFREFPKQVGRWEGRDAETDFRIFKTLGVDDELSRIYRDGEHDPVELYIGYFRHQNLEKEIVNFRIDGMMENRIEHEIALSSGKRMKINKVVYEENHKKKILLYWFVNHGRLLTSKYQQKMFTVWDALIHNETNASIVIFSADLVDEKDAEEKARVATEFAGAVYPVLGNFLP